MRGQSLVEGDKLNLKCEASGNPSPSFRWFKDGHELQKGRDLKIKTNKIYVMIYVRIYVMIYVRIYVMIYVRIYVMIYVMICYDLCYDLCYVLCYDLL
ncbi:Pro-neuregulin-2, membrane-bound isoform [Liparis tanakae]|uniref:Pro-neuregulin-2, membrane-bound isoform n=1 Tax=Liparis tanakae TaxID=230148 RepID=A0A4Z2HI93_9TELE|nr:Pro-neuregulin-2, membrane-bound isoform [Liparis tanakae]